MTQKHEEWHRCGYHRVRVPHHNPVIIIDKTCIHQVDKELQAKSIKKLGAFLRMSSHLVIIYTSVYLKKLWTVYELACFLALHPGENPTIIPTYVPMLVFGGIAISCGSAWLLLLGKFFGIYYAYYAALLFAFYAAGIIMRRGTHELEATRRDMKHFELEECMC